MEALLTADELADALRLTPETVREWSRAGKIPCVRLGARSIRYRLADVIEELERRNAATREEMKP